MIFRNATVFCIFFCFLSYGRDLATAVAVGSRHGLLLKSDGTVWAWGANSLGELGTESGDRLTPDRVTGVPAARAIAAGEAFSLALANDGTVWRWGEKKWLRPEKIAGIPAMAAIAAAGKHALCLDADGSVWEWGEVPNGRTIVEPTKVPDAPKIVAIAASQTHSVALDATGSIWLWGDHGAGPLVGGDFGFSPVPRKVPGLKDISGIGASYELTIAIKKDGTVWTLGYGAAGGLGNGSTQNASYQPVPVPGLSGVKAVAGGYMHVLALKADGTVWAWGSNHERQLGNPRITADVLAKPVRCGVLTGIAAIAAAGNHSIAVTPAGDLWTWGQNDGGVLGADPEALRQSDVPMKAGQEIPPECNPLFACLTDAGKVIRICGDQDDSDVGKWTNIQYRYGPESGPPELVFPADPARKPSPLRFAEDPRGEYLITIRFSTGKYTYRLFSGSTSGAGVDVLDPQGKRIARIACAERPAMFSEYLKANLPHEPRSSQK